MHKLIAILLAWPLAGASAVAAQQVHRCLDAGGARVYADRACIHLGLEDETPPARPPSDYGNPSVGGLSLEVDSGPAAASAGCPGPSPEALREGVLAAIGARDLNSLTGMYHWAGAGRHSASSVISRMQSLIAAAPQAAELRQPEVNDDWLWAGQPPPSGPADPELVLLARANAFDPLARFQLRMQAGCYWLADR